MSASAAFVLTLKIKDPDGDSTPEATNSTTTARANCTGTRRCLSLQNSAPDHVDFKYAVLRLSRSPSRDTQGGAFLR